MAFRKKTTNGGGGDIDFISDPPAHRDTSSSPSAHERKRNDILFVIFTLRDPPASLLTCPCRTSGATVSRPGAHRSYTRRGRGSWPCTSDSGSGFRRSLQQQHDHARGAWCLTAECRGREPLSTLVYSMRFDTRRFPRSYFLCARDTRTAADMRLLEEMLKDSIF